MGLGPSPKKALWATAHFWEGHGEKEDGGNPPSLPDQSRSQAGGHPELTFGSKQRGVARLVAKRLPIMLGREAWGEGQCLGFLDQPLPEGGKSRGAPLTQPKRGAHLSVAPGRQRLAAAFTLEAEPVPVPAQGAHLLS